MRTGVKETRKHAQMSLVGHELQLMWLTSGLRLRIDGEDGPSDINRLFYLHGPEGIGRRTFIERLWEILQETETPRIIFPIDSKQEIPVEDQIRSGCAASKPYYESLLEQLAAEMDERIANFEESGKKLPPMGIIALWSATIQQHLIEDSDAKSLQMIFVFHDFVLLPELQRKLLARAIPPSSGNIDIRVILTGTEDFWENEEEILFSEMAPFSAINLPPLTKKEVEKWLYAKELPVEIAQELFYRTNGLPAKLERESRTLLAERGAHLLLNSAECALREIDGELRKYICMASMLPEVNRDSLHAIMPEIRAGETLSALRECAHPDCYWRDETFYFSGRVSHALEAYLAANHTAIHEQTKETVEALASLCAALPIYQDRLELVGLLPFHYFNRHVLLEIMPEQAERRYAFAIRNVGKYFERSGENLRMTPLARQLAEKYARLTRQSEDAMIRYKVERLWMHHKKQLGERLEDCESTLNKDTVALISLKHRLSLLGTTHAAMRDARQSNSNLHQPEDQGAAGMRDSALSSIGLQGIGAGALSLCLLSSSRAALVFAVVGLCLILGGLLLERRRTKHKNRELPPLAEPVEASNANLRNSLEMKQEWLTSKIAGEKQEILNLVKQLDQPYAQPSVKKT